MNWILPFSKQHYIDCLLKAKEISPRKLNGRYPELVAFIKPLMQDENDFQRQAYLVLYDYKPKCDNPNCNNIPAFETFTKGYRKTCSSTCNRLMNPQGCTSPAAKQALANTVAIRDAAHKEDQKRMITEGSAICEYCKRQAKFYSRQNETWRCTPRPQDCPAAGPKRGVGLSNRMKGVSRSATATPIEPKEGQLCFYGCGQKAYYRLTKSCGGKLCCSVCHQACRVQREKRSIIMGSNFRNEEAKKEFIQRMELAWRSNHSMSEVLSAEQEQQEFGAYLKEHETQFVSKKKNSFSIKPYKKPSGEIIGMRGYENMAADYLFQEFAEPDVCCDLDPHNSPPTISYGFNGRKHAYRPDFFIKSLNTIIEVKSIYYYSSLNDNMFQKNKLKEAAALAEGFDFIWFIYKDRNKELLSAEERAQLDTISQAKLFKLSTE